MSSPDTLARNLPAMDNLDRDIHDLFRAHPKAILNDADVPVIPGDALVDILRTFSANSKGGVQLMSKEEEELLAQLIESNPGLEVTPQVLLQFIAQRAALAQQATPAQPPSPEGHEIVLGRGRPGEKTEYVYDNRSRSSSQDATGASVYRPYSRPPSRGPSVPPKTPSSSRESPFDVSTRQRSTPLTAPSSWTRRPPPARRRSDAGLLADSDSESSMSPPPVAFSRSYGPGGRSRAPSNPSTPGPHSARASGTLSPISIGNTSSFARSISRPHSRTQSYPQAQFASIGSLSDGYRYPSADDDDDDYGYEYDRPFDRQTGMMSPPPSDQSDLSMELDERSHRRMTLTMLRRSSDSDGEDGPEDEDPTYGASHMREATSSTVSLSTHEQLDALHKVNDELRKKLKDTEDTLQKKLSEHEGDLNDMHQRMEELESELATTKGRERELRSKERTNSSEIHTLENKVTNLSKGLETSRAALSNLNSLYQDQCAEASRIRELLLQREEEVSRLSDTHYLQSIEAKKLDDELLAWQHQVKVLEDELAAAHQAQQALDQQKHENMGLKETIERMRFEMDEMRQAAVSGHASSGPASVKASISRSLGAELASKMKEVDWQSNDEELVTDERQEAEATESDETESEDVIQTIITRTKRKVASRAKRIETQTFEEVKEYSDASVQHSLATGTFSVQTDPEPRPVVFSASIQTNESPCASMEIQTDPEPVPPPVLRSEIEIQTDELEPEPSFAPEPTEADDEALASSSSTLVPATPKPEKVQLDGSAHDLPPAYNQVTDDLSRIADETLETWHKGLKLPIQGLPGGVSEEAAEDWRALKAELGVECGAIDRLIEESARSTGFPRPSKDARRRSRFYNIYNTYVYGGKGYALLSSSQIMFIVGATAASAFFLGQFMTLHNSPLGGPTYYDRAAWSSFNSLPSAGEGFPGNSPTAFWGLLGRLGGGAARTLRGFPT